jgi:excisionase family DNA binding protein
MSDHERRSRTKTDAECGERTKEPNPTGLGMGSGVEADAKKGPVVTDRLLTVGEVADVMRVSSMTVYRMIKAGALAAIRVGKNYRIRESDVGRYFSDRLVRVEHH